MKVGDFFNRELSWIEFNRRVLSEALLDTNPLLERLKFLYIVSTNFDEFFMIRVAAIKRVSRQSARSICPTGITPSRELELISQKVHEIVNEQYRCLQEEILPGLAKNGPVYTKPGAYTDQQSRFAQNLFDSEIFLSLTPVRVEPEKGFPFTTNLRLHILFLLEPISAQRKEKRKYCLVPIPPALERVYWLPNVGGRACFTLLEDIIIANAGKLFLGYNIKDYTIFRVTRDADLSVDEERDEDFVEAMEEVLVNRNLSTPVRLEILKGAEELKNLLVSALKLDSEDVYELSGPIDLKGFKSLVLASGFDYIRFEEWQPVKPASFKDDISLWDNIKSEDLLIHHPYESFEPVVALVNEAARDPAVIAIKMTLYRTSGKSPIVKALSEAAKNGKQVTVAVELKARFDEERNIGWVEHLERTGAIVIYGIAHLKIHAKTLLIFRRERHGIIRYMHIGTGNYNDKTARYYVDIGYFSASEELTYELGLFFNAITGYSSVPNLKKLIMAPSGMKEKLIHFIEREIENAKNNNPALIMLKMNNIADVDMINALYRASQAGVTVKINIRGVCMLVPGKEGLSENISVISIIDRFLEHSRIYYFYNNGERNVYLGSPDWMPRNLERRIELMFPVEQENLKNRIIKILEAYFKDNTKAFRLFENGSYVLKEPAPGEKVFRAQEHFYNEARQASMAARSSTKREFVVRRTPLENV
ncbi:MAG: polyphosphate kinase 1 [Spirochaetes bacterium]|nr:MAG: polyphosphate kinase 1 [Spirochaetota bacterium]